MAESSSLVTSPFEVNSGSGDFGSVYEIEREEEYYPLVYEVESSPTGFRGVSGDVQILSEYHDFDLLDQPTLCLPSPTCCGSSLREVDINRIKNAYNISESVDLRIPLEDEGPKNAYNISESVDLRIPLEDEGPDCNRPDEVVVYEAFFALGLRDSVPSLVAKIANFIGISPGQLNPRAWRLLIAIQVFSEIYPVSLGLEEVLFVYFFKCYDSVNYLYLIQKRRPDSSPLVYDLDRQVRYKTPYEKQWHKKFLFMRVGRDPGYPVTWFPRDR
ncbi:unnamed protein product [Arabis nemorensis]|uniref:Uncharacterized protein n=1 Tax=Arabis nemorensis TaxID=586526 RepID=A0A565BSR6_9BRAS|nr:unnamed protein product [Arabis nemorensis]